MKTFLLSSLTLFWAFSLFAAPCPKPWVCEELKYYGDESIRAGYWPEKGAFKGNVLYLQGLGDSMMNHAPLFQKLSDAGFRVIAFDYMGQGGSTGKMNNTRIFNIVELGNIAWKRFGRSLKVYPEKTVIGWSTGGLAAYMMAAHKLADRVVLIAPGIAPRTIVGNGLGGFPINEITMDSLTSARFSPSSDPHLDPIKPNSPLKVPLFAVNLLQTAAEARQTYISSKVKGFVLISGKEDTYVNAAKTVRVLKKNAPHFKVKTYAGARHEIDNERPSISVPAHKNILNFLLQ